MQRPTQEIFLEALWDSFQKAKYEGLEWKYIEWVRDPCCKRIGITKAEFNTYLEEALEDSDEGRNGWDIIVDCDVGPAREAQVRRITPVVVCGLRGYLIYMKPFPTEEEPVYIRDEAV